MKLEYLLEWSSFKTINNHYVLDFNSDKLNMYFQMKDGTKYDFESSYFIFIQDFKHDVVIPNETYEKKSIYEAGTKFSEEFWNTSNSFPFTANDKMFINSFPKN